jgi:hypothetical protein
MSRRSVSKDWLFYATLSKYGFVPTAYSLSANPFQIFSKAPDPDYPEALLLEQHQAPITAALTPAFSSDSTPEILSSAIDACAVFVGCGVVKDVSRMGRILKQLNGRP